MRHASSWLPASLPVPTRLQVPPPQGAGVGVLRRPPEGSGLNTKGMHAASGKELLQGVLGAWQPGAPVGGGVTIAYSGASREGHGVRGQRVTVQARAQVAHPPLRCCQQGNSHVGSLTYPITMPWSSAPGAAILCRGRPRRRH
jgi:hypothetical protein